MKKYRIRDNSIAAKALDLENKINNSAWGVVIMGIFGLMLAGIFAWGMNEVHPF